MQQKDFYPHPNLKRKLLCLWADGGYSEMGAYYWHGDMSTRVSKG